MDIIIVLIKLLTICVHLATALDERQHHLTVMRTSMVKTKASFSGSIIWDQSKSPKKGKEEKIWTLLKWWTRMKLRNGLQIFGNLPSELFSGFDVSASVDRVVFDERGWDREASPQRGQTRPQSLFVSLSDGLLSFLFRVDAFGGWMLATCLWWTTPHRPCQKPFSPAGWQCYTLKTPAWAANLSSHLVCPAHTIQLKCMRANNRRKFGCLLPENLTLCCEMQIMLTGALWVMGLTT